MLSFFSKKKHSPDTPPEDVIQGPADPAARNVNSGDEFVFVEKKTSDDPPQLPSIPSLYPPVSNFGLPYPTGGGISSGSSSNAVNVPPLHGVPFQLAPQLCTKSTFEVTQMQVDGILAILTRQMSVTEDEEYSFALERSIQNECY